MMGFDFLLLAANHAAQIAAVAAMAWCATRLLARDRPHLAHALWALVLLKSLTPPVIPSPTSPFSWLAVCRPSASAREIQSVSNEMLNPAQTLVRIETGHHFPKLKSVPPTGETVLYSEPVRKASYQIWFVGVWAASSLLLLLIHAGQFFRFTTIVRKTSIAVPPDILEEVAQLRRTLGIRRPVQVRILDALIGPAVMGILRPTLLLPKAIVCASNSAQLRPLLAHELVHIRRGDLVWSAFQVIALSLWWFHPAVRLANRLLIQESERSCDEETIASLGCKPAAYARSLLAVLETKQQLSAAPIVPGLRPVDITSNRMERIMRIGQGSHLRTPGWVCATLIVGAIIMLPGAAWLKAQESGGESNLPERQLPLAPPSFSDSATTNSSANTVAAALTITASPVPESTVASAESSEDALQINLLIFEIPWELVQELRSVDAQVRAAKTEPRDLQQLDSDGNVNLIGAIDKGSVVRSDLGIAGQLVVEEESFVVPVSTSPPLPKLMPGVARAPWLLNDTAQQRVQEWCKNTRDKNIRILNRPRIVTRSGTPASVEIGQEKPFTVGHDKKSGKPIIENIKTGLSCEISATLLTRDLNKADFSVPVNTQFVRMECRLRHTEIVHVQESTFALEDGSSVTVQQPSYYSRFVEFMLNVPLGATFASADGISRTENGDSTTLFVVTVDRVRSAQTAK